MAHAQYICPKCKRRTAKSCIYNPGKYKHKCTKCGSQNVIKVSGSELFIPQVMEVRTCKQNE